MVDPYLVKVIIPIYTTELSDTEWISLDRCFDILKRYSICFVIPDGLDMTVIEKRYGKRETYSFDKSYFKRVKRV